MAVEPGQRARVVLIGGDAHRLRALRLFLDQLSVFEPVAIATGGAGLNALNRQPWDCAVVVDDLRDMVAELRRLNPKPGHVFGSEPVQPVVPDVFVRAAPDRRRASRPRARPRAGARAPTSAVPCTWTCARRWSGGSAARYHSPL